MERGWLLMGFGITSGVVASAQKVVIYGVEGIGKSTFAARFPDPLFIDTEGGTKHMDVKRLDKPSSWTMLEQEIDWVKANPSCCSTLVIDTIDWAEQLCIDHICAKHQKSGIESWDYGKGFVFLAEEFGRMLNRLTDLTEKGTNVLLVAHSKVKKEERPEEYSGYDRWMLKLSDFGQKKVAPLVKEWADALLFMNYKTIVETTKEGRGKARGGERVIYTTHHACWDAKNRWGLPDAIPFDFSIIAPHVPAKAAQASPPTAASSAKAEPVDAAPKPVQTVVFGRDGTVVSDTAAQAAPVKVEEVLPPHLQQLRDLMAKDGINDAQIRDAVGARGWFTEDTPIENYPADFVTGALVADWPKVVAFVESRKPYTDPLPFE